MNNTLQATELVHEVYARFARTGSDAFESAAHFFGAAARAMQQILIERARARSTDKRGGGWRRVTFPATGDAADPLDSEEVLATSEAIDRLAESSPEAAEIVSLRYYAGLTVPEVAEALGTSPSSVERRWRFARAWLRRELEGRG